MGGVNGSGVHGASGSKAMLRYAEGHFEGHIVGHAGVCLGRGCGVCVVSF